MTPASFLRIRHVLALACVVVLGWLSACRPSNPVVVPNRVLDRPLDVVLTCVRRTEDGTVEVTDLSTCRAPAASDCDEVDVPQLIGFVANSEKNEVGMFRRCDQNGMVDLDPEAPGYNLVPVGSCGPRTAASSLRTSAAAI
jgi:hypothetical protein